MAQSLHANQRIIVDITHPNLVRFLDDNRIVHSRRVGGRVSCFFRSGGHMYGISASHVLLAPGHVVSIRGTEDELIPIGVVQHIANNRVTWRPTVLGGGGQFVVRRWWEEDYAVFRLSEGLDEYVDPLSIIDSEWLNVGDMYALNEAALLQMTPQAKYANFRRHSSPQSVLADYEAYFLHVVGQAPIPGDSGSAFLQAGKYMALVVTVTQSVIPALTGVIDMWHILDQLVPDDA